MRVVSSCLFQLCLMGTAVLIAAGGANAQPYATFPMAPGETVITCFSGLDPVLVNQGQFVAEPDGYVVAVVDNRLPPVDFNVPTPVLDVNWLTLFFHNETASQTTDIWDGNNLGQVFGVCLDDGNPPNIYVTATTVYGLFPFGPGGSGAVYRIDGATGEICILAQLPNSGQGLGNVCFDGANRRLLVSNFEDGLIYGVNVDSNDPSNPCNVGDPIALYDHGLNGRPSESLAPIPDDPTTGFTERGRRVWGLEIYDSRLFYGVWWKDSGTGSSQNNEVWSVEITPSGSINAATAQLEFGLPATSSNPVSDINFTDDGDLYTSERTIPGDTGQLHNGNRSAHASHLIKWEGTAGSYTQSIEEYKTGSIFGESNSAGGAAIDCQENVWATGDALHFGGATGHTDTIYGLQWIAAGGNAGNPATQNSYVVGLAGGGGPGFAKAEIGDVEIYEEPCSCMELEVEHILCDLDDDGGATVTFNVTNLSGVDAARILLTPQTPGLTVSPNIINTPVPDGGSTSVTVNIGGYVEGEEFCFTVTLLDATGNACCSDELCFTIECECLQIRRDRIVCDPDNPGTWLYSFQFDNLTPDILEHVYLFPNDPTITFTPAYFDIPSLAPNTTSGPLTVAITGGQAGDEICFQITVHDQLLRECCAIEVCIVLPDCCEVGPDGTVDPCCDDREPPQIGLLTPFPQIIDCGVDFKIPEARAEDNCDEFVQVVVQGTIDTSTPGQQCVTYTATDSSGNTASVIHCVTVLDNCCQPDSEPPVITLPVECPFSINCRDLDFTIPQASATDNCDGDVTEKVEVEGQVDVNTPGVYCITYTVSDSFGNVATEQCCITVLDNCGDTPIKNHAADFIRDFLIELKELLRVIQLFNSGAYHCDPTTEDGYAPGAGTHEGAPHSCDYNGQDWSISLTELLRIVQLFNAGGYYECVSGEDGFCPGAAS